MSRQLHGLKAWLLQRVTAVYLALYLLYLMAMFVLAPPQDYHAWRAWAAEPAISLSLMLFFIALALHAWVGMRDIFMDYVQSVGLKLIMLSVLGMALVASVLWALQAIVLLHIAA